MAGHGGTTYNGYTIPHNKRWHTVAGKGLCAVMWYLLQILCLPACLPLSLRFAQMGSACSPPSLLLLDQLEIRFGFSTGLSRMVLCSWVCVILGMVMMTTLMAMDMSMRYHRLTFLSSLA
ncbi:hypothetical protein ABZP36_012254 [Zizania latifolia]